MKRDTVWVFCGERNTFPSGVFLTRALAEAWIAKYGLSGALTAYPVNKGVYDWAIENGVFAPAKDSEKTPDYIQRYSDARQEHIYYKLGVNELAIDLTCYPIGNYYVELCHLGRNPVTGKRVVSVEVADREGKALAKSGKIDADEISVELLEKLLPEKFPEEKLSEIVEASWKDKFVL